METLERLAYCLRERTPVLLLGAGFSRGAINHKNEELPKGDELAKGLFQYCYIDHPPIGKDKSYIEDIRAMSGNLRQLCTIIDSEKRKELRDDFFIDVFSDCRLKVNQKQALITSYEWERIFTLNIDDLVEHIYKKQKIELAIWYGDEAYKKTNHVELFKLHGCVTKRHNGFVFDDREYHAFTTENNYMLREFGESYIKNDMIFIGTEFQESDLSLLLQEFASAGYDAGPENGNHYFFVSPSIHNVSLKNQIQSSPNMHWLNMTTEDFLQYVDENISKSKTIRHLLIEKGVVFIDEFYSKLPQQLSSDNYKSDLYIGEEPNYLDIFNYWDITYPGLDPILRKVMNAKSHRVFSIYGKSYVGKTCIAKRALIKLRNQNFIAIELIQCSSHVLELLSRYIESLPKGAKIGVLIENSAYQYNLIASFLREFANRLIDKRVIFITTDLEQNHLSKRYILAEHNLMADMHVTEKISLHYAENIFTKLMSKKRLGNLLSLPGAPTHGNVMRAKGKIIRHMRSVDDIIDILYYASEGRKFEDYFSEYLETRGSNTVYKKYLQALCTLGQLGITNISGRIVPKLLPSMSKRYNINAFKKEYDSLLVVKNGSIHVRCMRIIQKASKEMLGEEETITLLKQVVLQTVGLFTENQYNEWSEIFQKALKARVLNRTKILSDENIYKLLNLLESECEKISYYWVQRGIAAQQLKLFEDANNHLNYAKDIRPNSYQVKHALAKNLMERGLYEYDADRHSSADDYFSQGREQMEALILAPDYSDAFRYSVHAYTDMAIKYSLRTKVALNSIQCNFIENLLLSMQTSPIDTKVKNLTSEFISYCNAHELTQYTSRLIKARKGLTVIRGSDYEISNLEIHLD